MSVMVLARRAGRVATGAWSGGEMRIAMDGKNKALRIGDGQVMLALALIGMGGKVYQHIIVVQYPAGSAVVGRVGELIGAKLPQEWVKRFDAGDAIQNRTHAVAYALEAAGYGRLEEF